MQPHANLGINFRRHFEPLGFSKKRSRRAIEEKISQTYNYFRAGTLKQTDAVRIISELKELKKLLK
jgi:hypothetical protein